MKTGFSVLVLLTVIALAGFSFVPGAALAGPVLWGGMAVLTLAGGLVWWLDWRAKRGGGDG